MPQPSHLQASSFLAALSAMPIAAIHLSSAPSFKISHSQQLADASTASISRAGDVNADGIADVILSLPPLKGKRQGQSYVIFGSRSGLTGRLDLAQLNGSNGFAIRGFAPAAFDTSSVSSAGDVNADGIDDLIVADVGDSTTAGRKSYVIFGQPGGFAAAVDLATLNGKNGFAIVGLGQSQINVTGAGDLNGDGIADVAIGQPDLIPSRSLQRLKPGDWAGQSAVIWGQPGGFTPSFDLASLNGTNGFRIQGEQILGRSGQPLQSAGDLNGDGLADLLIGAFGHSQSLDQSGVLYGLWGSRQPFPAAINLSELSGQGFVVRDIPTTYGSGEVSNVGDVNADGLADFMIGAPYANGRNGRSYVIFGSREGLNSGFQLSDLNGVSFVVETDEAFAYMGAPASRLGDVNGDGVDDLLIVAEGFSKYKASVIFGSRSGFSREVKLNSLNGDNGFSIDTQRGVTWISNPQGVGDINGDGFADIMLYRSGIGRNNRSEFEVIFGGASYGTSADDQMMGSDRADVSYGFGGNDTLMGQQSNDTLVGGKGSDILSGGIGDDTLIGEAGSNRLTGGEGQDRFVFAETRFRQPGESANTRISRITDFDAADQIVLSRIAFTQVRRRTFQTETFQIETVNKIAQAERSKARIVYQQSTGTVFYNENGAAPGLGSGGAFTTLANRPPLTAADFAII